MLGVASKVYWPRFLPQRLSLLLVTGITDSMACLTSHPGNHTFCSARILRNELFHTKPRVFLPSHVPYYARPVLCLSTKATISVNGVRHGVKDAQSLLKKNWLNSISCPFPEGLGVPDLTLQEEGPGCHWVIGIDPDIHGAVALLKFDDSCCSAQVFDTPKLQVMVGKRVRNRPDARSIVQLLRGFGAPPGTTAYIEQSTPFPNDGKLGWYSGGYSYGLWIGVLVASGFSVSPISSRVWKDHYELSGGSVAKDDSRKAACLLFPSMSSLLKRKKDHGRAEALLIAAYAKGLKLPVG